MHKDLKLKWKEWDLIQGGLRSFEAAEWKAIDKGCECFMECDPHDEIGCFSETTIHMLRELMSKIEIIKGTLWAAEMGLKE